MAEAVDLAKLYGEEPVERALAASADAGRFDEGDLAAILNHQENGATVIQFPTVKETCEEHTLQRSTQAWEAFGR
jgi:hypothetical protein